MKNVWERKLLGDLLDEPETVNPVHAPTKEFSYIDVSSISNATYRIESTQRLLGKDAPSRARKLVRTNDILFATIRPTLRRIAIVPKHLDGQVCSTGYLVLRPKVGIDHRFLFHSLLREDFLEAMRRLQKGASYPAVSDSDVKGQFVSLPPLQEQRRIASILDAAEALRSKRHAALGQIDQLTTGFFLKMFGPESTSDWPIVRLGEIASRRAGSIRTGPFGSQLLHSEFVDSGIPVLGIDNVVTNRFTWGESRFVTPEKYKQLGRYEVKPGDVLITIMGTCGRCAIVPDDIPTAINTKHLCCITLDQAKCLPTFLQAYFLRHPMAQAYLRSHAKGAIMAGLNMGIIKDMPIPIPPISLQERFHRLFLQIEALEISLQSSACLHDELFRSLQFQAFQSHF